MSEETKTFNSEIKDLGDKIVALTCCRPRNWLTI